MIIREPNWYEDNAEFIPLLIGGLLVTVLKMSDVVNNQLAIIFESINLGGSSQSEH